MNDARGVAMQMLKEKGHVRSEELATFLGVSRVYAQKILKDLVREGVLYKVGKTKGSYYIHADETAIQKSIKEKRRVTLHLKNEGLDEARVFADVQKSTGILLGVPENVIGLFRHGFTEMLNNAIDHSQSETIVVEARRTETALTFSVRDFGIGIFNNVRDTFRLPGTLEAIQEILKGKRTTDKARHTGQGIFFTSKMADVFIIDSFEKSLTVNNLISDIFIQDHRNLRGTRVTFSVHVTSTKTTKEVFDAFTGTADDDYAFTKTSVTVKLYKYGKDLPSRSEAKRVMVSLENFMEVELDFTGVETVGQAFADEIFRVWNSQYPNTKVVATNVSENVAFMIKRANGEIRQNTLGI